MQTKDNNKSNSRLENLTWDNVGVFPTPQGIVDKFVKFTIESMNKNSSNLEILDLFAGDGRLGYSISQQLPEKKIKGLTYLEIRENLIPQNILNGKTNVITQNGFKYTPLIKYNLIISNPPYLAVNTKQSEEMGFSWEDTKKNCRNLYGLAISKGLELCAPNGILVVIAPFGYLRGVNSAEFRQEIEIQCSEVIINASSDRTLFEGVNQDIAFQTFIKRNSNFKNRTKWKFAYNGCRPFKTIHVNLPFSKLTAEKYVRVGPIVWNRKKEFLCHQPESNIALIYGGNINHEGEIVIPHNRYLKKQYINKKGTIPTDVLTAPFIAIRRTLRGIPGEWEIDLALITDENLVCTAENHVIIIELPQIIKSKLLTIKNKLKSKIREFYFHSGSPNISTKIVSQIFSQIISKNF